MCEGEYFEDFVCEFCEFYREFKRFFNVIGVFECFDSFRGILDEEMELFIGEFSEL